MKITRHIKNLNDTRPYYQCQNRKKKLVLKLSISRKEKHGNMVCRRTTYVKSHIHNAKNMAAVGFEPSLPKRLVPKTSALDHSATLPDEVTARDVEL